MTPEVHISDIRTFRSCRRKWQWSSRLRENLETIAPYPPFFTGKAIHAALEFYYQDKAEFANTLAKYFKQESDNIAQLGTLWPHEVAQIEEQVDLIEGLIEHYIIWQEQDKTKYCDDNLEFISMEEAFHVELMPGVDFGGRMDGLVKHIPTGEYWIFETKTARSIQELANSLANDEQSGAYLWAARQWCDFPIKGVLYNIMRKKSPMAPRMLAGGSLSKATNIDTSAYYYKYCIQQTYPDWSEETIEEMYGDILEVLREKNQKFFMRLPIFRTDYELELLIKGLRETAKEMLNPDIALYPSPGWNTCTFCGFKSPCLTMNAGGDYQALLESEFQVRESHESMRSKEDE